MILFIDDDRCFLRVVSHMLKCHDLPLTTVNKVPDAIEWLEKNEPCKLIFLDLHMRGATGPEILKWLKNNNSDIPIVILSDPNRDNFKDLSENEELPILPKPFNGEELMASVKEHYQGGLSQEK